MNQGVMGADGAIRKARLLLFLILPFIVVAMAVSGCSSPAKPVPTSSSSAQSLQVVSDTPYSGSSASSTLAMSDQGLASQLDSDVLMIASQSGMQTSVAVIDLPTGTRAGYQADERMLSASMIKLVIAATFLEKVKAGEYSLDELYTLQQSDIVGGTGTLGGYGAGAQVTYGEILDKMISVSDNTGANILIDAVGMDAVNEEARKLELTATQLNRHMMDSEAMAAGIENYTSAEDVATLLAMVYNGTFVDAESSSVVLRALEGQQDSGGISAGLPYGTVFAHKTGSLGTVRHDGGIVEGQHPFVLVVMCGGDGFYEQGAHNVMASIAEAVYSDIVG